jgi:histidyl-tRNA synthetase
LNLTRLRGFQDLIGERAEIFALVEDRAREVVRRYGASEIRIPLLERIELYVRSSGETSDVVEKQMYSFTDRDEAETTLALRPEGTPGVVRAYIEAGLDRSDPEQRFFYFGPMFRRERPQKGRHRQFYQFGVEILGRPDAVTDVELILMIDDLRRELWLELTTEINSLGCSDCRPAFRAALLAYGRAHLSELCEDCHSRLERNPLRLLDCKIDVKLAENAPRTVDYLCDACKRHFDQIRHLLGANDVAYRFNPRLVRGLDYYTRTAFEVISDSVGAQSSVAAGGRYDGLVEALGGAAVAGTGFAIGVDRLALACEVAKKPALLEKELSPRDFTRNRAKASIAIISMGEEAAKRAMPAARGLRDRGFSVEFLSPDRKLKALLQRADKMGARFAIIIGENELNRGVAQLRDLKKSEQREVALDKVEDVARLAAELARTDE